MLLYDKAEVPIKFYVIQDNDKPDRWTVIKLFCLSEVLLDKVSSHKIKLWEVSDSPSIFTLRCNGIEVLTHQKNSHCRKYIPGYLKSFAFWSRGWEVRNIVEYFTLRRKCNTAKLLSNMTRP